MTEARLSVYLKEKIMRMFIINCLVVLLTCGFMQKDREDYSTGFIRSLLQNPHFSTGFAEKKLSRLGDRVAIAIIKIIDDKDKNDIEKITYIVNFLLPEAFAAPKLIEVEEDKKPKVTLFFLQHLKDTSEDPKLSEEITRAINRIQAQTTNKE